MEGSAKPLAIRSQLVRTDLLRDSLDRLGFHILLPLTIPCNFLLTTFLDCILLIIGGPLYSLLVWRYTQYAITTKRVILESGVIGRDFRTVDFDQLANVEVNVGLVDRLFGTGSILMYTAGGAWEQPYSRRGGSVTAPSFSHIKNPYNVFKFFKKVSFDVKTDELYPNKYRPDVNPGYDTKYTGDTEPG